MAITIAISIESKSNLIPSIGPIVQHPLNAEPRGIMRTRTPSMRAKVSTGSTLSSPAAPAAAAVPVDARRSLAPRRKH